MSLPVDAPDILVMQRGGNAGRSDEEVIEAVRTCRGRGTRLVYDIDDNLLDTHPVPQTERSIAGRRRLIRYMAREADAVVVSTPLLAERLRRMNANIWVVPNRLDSRRLPSPRGARRQGLRVGYYGTFTHLGDLMAVAGPTRAALAAAPTRVTMVLCGISLHPGIRALFEDVADVEVMQVTGDYTSFVEMMAAEGDWDVGLAPLADGAFERSKSDIKFLEYAAFGIAGLYSRHPAYKTVVEGHTGLLADPGSWALALARLLSDTHLRGRIVAEARAYVLGQRMLGGQGTGWVDVLESLRRPVA